MFNLILISCIFLIGFFVSPIYAVVISCFALFFNSPAKIGFKRIDIFIVIYVAIVSLFYMQLDKIPAIKEPNKLTIRVDAGTPIIVYSKVLTKYLNEAPIIAPVKRAR